MIATETPTYKTSVKIVTQIFAEETFTCISVAETSNCIIATVIIITATKRSTIISTAESTTKIIATEPQKTCIIATDIDTCIIAIESDSCIVPTETATSRIDNRNFHLQKW